MNGVTQWSYIVVVVQMSYFSQMVSHGKWQNLGALIRTVGGDDVNLVQQTYYNDHDGFSGAKVQHVLQADGLCYSFTCPLQ
jgi:hypothetical protein